MQPSAEQMQQSEENKSTSNYKEKEGWWSMDLCLDPNRNDDQEESQLYIQIPKEYALPGNCDTCALCFQKFIEGDIISTAPCSRSFHENCLAEWLKTNPTCPTCETEFLDDSIPYDYGNPAHLYNGADGFGNPNSHSDSEEDTDSRSHDHSDSD